MWKLQPPSPLKKVTPSFPATRLKSWGPDTMTMSFSRIILNLMFCDSKKCFKKKFITMTLKQNVAWWLSQSSKLFWGKSSNCSNVVTGNPFLNLIWSLLILAFDFWIWFLVLYLKKTVLRQTFKRIDQILSETLIS